MKIVLIATVIILVSIHVGAQTTGPRELTCTERAFNFSFSLGTKWRLSALKMGPAEVMREGLDYVPAWSLKPNEVKPETPLSPLVQNPLKVGALSYRADLQSHALLTHPNSFGTAYKPRYLFPGINFSTLINTQPVVPANTWTLYVK